MKQPKVLVGSPVCQTTAILAKFLASIKALNCTGLQMDDMFVDDNTEEESSRQLERVERSGAKVVLPLANDCSRSIYDEASRHWDDSFMLHVSRRKVQWEETGKTQSNWILNPDTDELVEDAFWENSQAIPCDGNLQRCCVREQYDSSLDAAPRRMDWQADEY